MCKKSVSLFLAVLLFALMFAGCGEKNDDQLYKEVTDLQLALLNNLLYQPALEDLEGKTIEGHEELIDKKYQKNIKGGDKLVDQLKGFTLIDFDHGDITGFKAAAFTKGKNLVIVYCGTEDVKDWIEDFKSGLFDFSVQDGQAKRFAIDNVKKRPDYDLFITGYSMGGRLCYLGTEAVIDDKLGDHLKKVRTFNGLGVKEFWDFKDSNCSNIHSLQEKFGDKTYDYIVEGDAVSDGNTPNSAKYVLGYNHIGTEFRVPCTNEIDTFKMKQHDLYSIIDYLLNHPSPAEDAGSSEKLDSVPVLALSSENHQLMGEFINVTEDVEVKTWNTFVSKYPQAADPYSSGREYFEKMHITLFFLKDNASNVIENKGVLNATGFGNDPCSWKEKYGEFDWMFGDKSEDYEVEKFYILYEDVYYCGPADCHVLTAKLREYVTLGAYEQDNNKENGGEAIEWLVLKQEDDRMLVVSKYCLDYLRYPDDWGSDIVWETSYIRSYLNNDFYDQSFTDEEKQSILLTDNENKASKDYYSTVDGNTTQDRVFLLSIAQVQECLPNSTSSESSKCAYGTDYLYEQMRSHEMTAHTKDGEKLSWALRADIDTDRNEKPFGMPREIRVYDTQIIMGLSTGGFRDPDGPLDAIRPAMWVSSTLPKHQ